MLTNNEYAAHAAKIAEIASEAARGFFGVDWALSSRPMKAR
ncbi:hypothetical protein [Roseovarius sp. M141]|nr:hypothetical protein [Roseovarius sp. M141]